MHEKYFETAFWEMEEETIVEGQESHQIHHKGIFIVLKTGAKPNGPATLSFPKPCTSIPVEVMSTQLYVGPVGCGLVFQL